MAPATNGRLVPVPTSPPPTTQVPADIRPQLSPPPVGRSTEGSASRLDSERAVFVHKIEGDDELLELTPPQITPGYRDDGFQETDSFRHVPDLIDVIPGEHSASNVETSSTLVPVSWNTPTVCKERRLPIDIVWDDTGWKSEQ
ncbi:MAG: hypothetical protein KDB11_17330 [Planctomycetales bacterium]|nr:hypothetical protein [Planctomycetales bacterium]